MFTCMSHAPSTNDITPNQINPWLYVASAVIVLLYIVSGIGHYFPQYLPITGLLLTPNVARELGVVELSEVVLWFAAMILFGKLAFGSHLGAGRLPLRLWCGFFMVLSFVALGEEASWGQHLGLINPSEDILDLNAQHEFNFHNLNAATLLGLEESHILYPYLNSQFGATKLLNPLFYAFCGMVWFFIPALTRRGMVQWFAPLRSFPLPERATSWFVLANLVGYLIVDKGFFDVAECLEFAMSMAAVFVPLDILRRERKKISEPHSLQAHPASAKR